MRRSTRLLLATVGLSALCATLASAQPPAAPAAPAPKPADPIGAVINSQEAPPQEALPPGVAPEGEVPPEQSFRVDIAPADPPPTARAPAGAPSTRPRFPIAVLEVVDKLTAESNRFEVRLDRPVQYKSLTFTVHACERTAPDEAAPDSIAHVQVDYEPVEANSRSKPPRRTIFRGWMFASSPSLNPLQNPTYDAWLVACKAE